MAVEFTSKALAHFKASQEYLNHPHHKLWLAVSPDNEPAKAVYHKLGFKDLEVNKEHKKLLMILNEEF